MSEHGPYHLSILASLRGLLIFTFIALNLSFWLVPLLCFALLRIAIPFQWPQRFAYRNMERIYRLAESFDTILFRRFLIREWHITGMEGLNPDKWYLIIANHQSWSDIFILQSVFSDKTPILKFLVKHQLLYMPVVGLICWAYEFPLLRRHTKSYLAKHPEKRDDDLQRLREACLRFKQNPSTIINFAEGTRFSESKRVARKTPYNRLLTPKPRGFCLILDAFGDQITEVLDVTIAYHSPRFNFWRLLRGDCQRVTVTVEKFPVADLLTPTNNGTTKRKYNDLKAWLAHRWREKDHLLDHTLRKP